jgi:CRP/FNR family transcriptional regulator, cyclic AMP receptor protein
VLLESAEGREFRLARLDAGDQFGEMALLDPEPRSATILAVDETELLVLRREDFVAWLLAHPQAMLRMLASLSRRLRQTDAYVGSFAFQDTATRLAHLLVLNAGSPARATRVAITQAELVSTVGATRQTVARVLGQWRRQGYVKTGRKHTLVLEPDTLLATYRTP